MKPIKDLVTDGKHFCVLPWIHFHSWPDKRVLPCCVADSSKPVSKIKKYESVIAMMNSEDYKKMRLAMLNDEPVEACSRCYDLEQIGSWTMRQSHNKRRGENLVEYIESVTEEDGSLNDFKMQYMDIRFSNICNMKCRSCGPSCSSLWAQEYIENNGEELTKKHFGITKMVVNSNEDQMFMAKLKPYLKDVEEVYFAGGEILITQEHYDCLNYWIDNGYAEKIELTYTTNFSSLRYKDKNLIDLWKKFPNLQIWASLDDGGEKAEFIRSGTDWERIVKNIHELKEQVPHAQFQITPTISIWNIFSFYKFFDTLIEQGLIAKNTNPRFNIATNPWFANIMVLPQHIKQRLALTYKEYIFKYSNNLSLSNSFKIIENTLKNGVENKEGILEFKRFNDNLDAIRNENHLDAIPELREVYEWAEK